MKVFVSVAHLSQVNYDTGEVLVVHKEWIESFLRCIESNEHIVFCAPSAFDRQCLFRL